MNLYVIMLRTQAEFRLLRRLVSDYPSLKNGFSLKEILSLPFISWDDRRILKNLFGGNYSKILTPEINFEYQNGKWSVEEIDVERGFHRFITKVLNHALEEGIYRIDSPVSTKDMKLAKFLMEKETEVYQEELKEFDDKGIPITQELLEFVSGGLRERLGEKSCFNYGLVKAFLESLHDYEEILIRKELG